MELVLGVLWQFESIYEESASLPNSTNADTKVYLLSIYLSVPDWFILSAF
jgi:hypothetical protein